MVSTVGGEAGGEVGVGLPSALLLEWMAHIKMSLDVVCDTSPRMWKTLNFILQSGGYTARGREPSAGRGAELGAGAHSA